MSLLYTKKLELPGYCVRKKILYTITFLFLLAIICCAAYYLTQSYDGLKHWYFSLNDCLPGKANWTANYFTPAVKAKGNILSVAAIVCSVFTIIYLLKSWKKIEPGEAKQVIEISTKDALWYGVIACTGVVLGLWSWSLTAPAYDEIYSAVNCAELHPFQTISYYLIPNNHLYFNLLNNIFFSWYSDQVYSGRAISLLAYICVLLYVFRWLYKLIGNHLFAFILLLPVALQLSAWGFAGQARGYESQLLCGWVAFITLLRYMQHGRAAALRTNTFFNVVGFVLLPSYLFWYLAQVLFLLCTKPSHRQSVFAYLKYQVLLMIFVFLLYLPAFCFSGIAAFTGNKYVKPIPGSWTAYLQSLYPYLRSVVSYCFSDLCGENSLANFILFFLPVILLFSKKKAQRWLGLFYIISWSVFVAMCLYLRHPAFYRNLIIHYSITMACVAYTFYTLLLTIASGLKITKHVRAFTFIACGIPLLLLSTHLLLHDKNDVSVKLYFNDVNALYSIHLNDISAMPKGSSVAFSYASFYYYYQCRKLHYNTSRCPNGHEDYFVNRPDEPLPLWVVNNYTLFRTCEEDYTIYKRK